MPFLATVDTEKVDQFSGLMPQTYKAIEPGFNDLFNSKRVKDGGREAGSEKNDKDDSEKKI